MTTTNVQTTKKSNKWIWWALGGAAVFCLCAVGVGVFVAKRTVQKVQEGVKADPASAAKAAQGIADYELPAGYQEQMAMDLFGYTMVVIAPGSGGTPTPSSKPVIMLAQFSVAGANQQQMEEQVRKSFEQQSGQKGYSMKVVETKQMTIRGEQVDVNIYEGTDENGKTMRQLITTFPGKSGTAMLMVMGDPDHWDQEEIDRFIESIH